MTKINDTLSNPQTCCPNDTLSKSSIILQVMVQDWGLHKTCKKAIRWELNQIAIINMNHKKHNFVIRITYL